MLELIVRYSGDLQRLSREIGFTAEELLGGYAIVTIGEEKAEELLSAKEILWTELPARVYTGAANGRRETGVVAVQTRFPGLTGKGVYVAVIDSGIDIFHPDFRNADGTTRIEALWDQTVQPRVADGDGKDAQSQVAGIGGEVLQRQGADGSGKVLQPPKGYRQGVLYTGEQINAILSGRGMAPDEGSILEGEAVSGKGIASGEEFFVPGQDLSGHGTHVAGIAAGNGRASQGKYRGVAYESTLLVVKLAGSQSDPFPQTTNLMTAVDFCVRYAAPKGVPVAINLSFGNQEGAHDGQSLLETYLDEAALYGKNVICIGTGNDAAMGRHTGGELRTGEEQEQLLLVGNGERRLRFGIWLSALDEIDVFLESPTGTVRQLTAGQEGIGVAIKGYPAAGGQVVSFGTTEAEVFFGQATPYRQLRQIEIMLRTREMGETVAQMKPYRTQGGEMETEMQTKHYKTQDGETENGEKNMSYKTQSGEIEAGNWRIRFRAGSVLDGKYDIWLSAGGISTLTRFQTPLAKRTLTIPSTAARGIAVAAYNSLTNGTAAFSGQGFPRNAGNVKPDLAAPGVDILSCAPGGGYTAKTGTSMATPFVTGSAALLLQWGIVLGNDPYLYGERLKARLISGTAPLAGAEERPNRFVGYGKLNLDAVFRAL